ncbi:myb-like protein AA isoform X2 [Argiope bruennichi]|uniref:myb-like protein AA isoform X2 n=1 Tax=Argiope bruennichi TaxID=94029 RepID=UPI0024944930|nr:myb-like protein AA isoform X2 [Argiope bruennichi]
MHVLFQITLLATLCEVYCVRLNPFTGFSDNYEPLTDFSINQGAYLPNMPMLSIYPKINDDSLNTMIGLPSLNSQMLSFSNPLLPSLSQTSISRPPSNQNKVKNNRNNNQRSPNSNSQQNQRTGPQKNRAVTLDVRGGGYKLEQKQNNRPYKAPVAAGSVRNTQRPNSNSNNNRNGGRNPGRPNNMPPRNRKPNNQRPRGPTMKNPHYNMKFETSLPSMPPNVEFVSPENVLPFHPRIYKQFLQQNKQFGSFLQNMEKMNPPKAKPQNNRNFGGPPFPGNGRNPGKQLPSKMTRNRGNQMSSSFAQSSQFSNFAPNFQTPGGQTPGSEMPPQFNFLQKQNAGKLFNPPFDANFFNQDTNFFSSFGQTSGGSPVLNQFQQQQQIGNQGKLPNMQPQGPPVANIPSTNTYQNSKPPSFGNSNPSYPGAVESPAIESGMPASFGNFFGSNQGMAQYDGNNMQSNTKIPDKEFQQMVQYYQQLQQQSSAPPRQYPAPPSPLGSASFSESPQSSSLISNYPPTQQFPNLSEQTNPYNEYQFMQDSSHQNAQTQIPGGQSLSYGKNANLPYEDSVLPSRYQANQDQVKSQLSDIHDQTDYTMPPFSPVDPLASAIDGSHQDIQDYYGYQQVSSNHKPSLYSNEQIAQNGGSSGMREISPYSEEKNSPEYETPLKDSNSKSISEESTAGYMTPEQLFAPHSTGLQSESKFVLSSSHGESKPSKDSLEAEASGSSVNEKHEGSERAALHLPEEVSIYVARQTDSPYLYEFTEAYDPFSFEANEKVKIESESSKQNDQTDSFDETESDEKINQSIKEFQKLLTKAPKSSYMVQPTESTSASTTSQTTTTRIPVYKKASDAEAEEMKNHKTTHSYMFQYAPAERSNTKANPIWNIRKSNASRYHLLLPETKPQITTTAAPTTTTTPLPTSSSTAVATPSYYHEPETPACARYNNLTYCLQDTEYPKDDIKRAIEKNRHPLDHFLIDISASSDVIDDSLNKVFENSVPLQSTSVSYSYEGKAISPSKGEVNNTAGCISNVQYAKPLRAINTAGLWKIIVNVEFEETGANYTQTVRIEECSHTTGYVATCGTETISACLQQYKLYRLLAWEPNRGFYIDAFLLPISCFCGSQQS